MTMAELRAVELRIFGARSCHSGSIYLSHKLAGSRKCISESNILKPFFIKVAPVIFVSGVSRARSEMSTTCDLAWQCRNRNSEYLAQRLKGDGPRPVMTNECEGSKKDFSLRSK